MTSGDITTQPLYEEKRGWTGITAASCQTYAGAFDCGARIEGFDVKVKVEQKDRFGMKAWLYNADEFIRTDVHYESGDIAAWPATNVDVVYGNPPCSGFSILTAGAKWQERGLHGAEATQNQCMWDLVEYGAQSGAQVVVFESVSHAMTKGYSLMCQLHDRLEEQTGRRWFLTLIRMNALSVGGWPDRKRFFFVASQAGPVSMPAANGWRRPLSEAIGDLEECVDYEDKYSPFGVSHSAKAKRHRELSAFRWMQGESCAAAYELAVMDGYEGTMPDRSDRILNPFTSWRWRYDKPARVITGAALDVAVHPTQPRTITHAEAGRIMGFPSWYDLRGITHQGAAGKALYGKGVPQQSARWVMEGVRRHLEVEDLDTDVIPQETDRPRTFTIDVMGAWRQNQVEEQLNIFSR